VAEGNERASARYLAVLAADGVNKIRSDLQSSA